MCAKQRRALSGADDDDDDDDDWLQPGNKFVEAVSKRQNGITKHLFPYRLVVKHVFQLQRNDSIFGDSKKSGKT